MNDENFSIFLGICMLIGFIFGIVNFIHTLIDRNATQDNFVNASMALIASPFLGIFIIPSAMILGIPLLPFIALGHLRKLIMKKR